MAEQGNVFLIGPMGAGKSTIGRQLAHALGVAARARGMSEVAKDAGLTREALYKALRPNAKPRFDTINRVCAALGVRLKAEPAPHH